jgi:hypothetical protein
MTTASNATTPSRPSAVTRRGPAPTPLTRSVRAELLKTVDTRSGRWLLVTIGVVVLALVAVTLLTAEPEDLTFRDFADVTGTPLSLLLPALAILSITTEWTQRTALNTFTLEPRRARVVLAKVLAVGTIGLLAVGAALAAAAAGNVAGSVLVGASGSWDVAPADVRDLVVTQVVAVLQGFAFGLLLTNTAAAVVAYYLLTPLLSTGLALVDALEDAAPWLDLTLATAPLSSGSPSAQDWAQLATAGALWVLLPLGLGLVRLLRREIGPE